MISQIKTKHGAIHESHLTPIYFILGEHFLVHKILIGEEGRPIVWRMI
jgi:hypothetical protein